jgi:hypothetical protein
VNRFWNKNTLHLGIAKSCGGGAGGKKQCFIPEYSTTIWLECLKQSGGEPVSRRGA